MKLILSFAMVAVFLGCSSKPEQPDVPSSPPPAAGASIEAKQVAAEQEASYVTEVNFSKGAATLNETSKNKVQDLIGTAKKVGDIEEVHVISWADQEYPSVHTKKLSKADRDLAKRRNDEFKKYLESLPGDLKVKTHNMAERPGALSSLVGSEDVRIKKSLEMAGIPTTDSAVKIPAKASRSIVMLILKAK